MNKRYKELAEQASLALFDDTAHYRLLPGFAEKFAELIIQQCINKHRELIANFSKPADGYEHTFPEFVEGVVHGLTEGIEGIEDLFGVK